MANWKVPVPLFLKSDRQCTSSDRSHYAQNKWDVVHLAPFIGLTIQDASDIQEQYPHKPVVQRMTLLEKWSQKLGREATYSKLKEGFEKIGRRDIAEDIGRMSMISVWKLLSIVIFVIYMVLTLMLAIKALSAGDTIPTSIVSRCTYYSPAFPTICDPGELEHDLPERAFKFIGREKNVSFIADTLLTNEFVHIININGAPGFGKSALAIHVGYTALHSNCMDVRYIDTTEHYWFSKTITTKAFVDNVVSKTMLQRWIIRKVSSYNTKNQYKTQLKLLLEWAESVKHPTLLILDNCDEILHSELRDALIELLKQIGQIQQRHIKIIVTSQERLRLHNSFASVDIKELEINDSVSLLTHLVPNISSHDAAKLAKAVEGNPLVLTIIGGIINNSGLEIMPSLSDQLENNPLEPTKGVSDEKSKFTVIMDSANKYIDRNAKECAKCLSYFPGSFDNKAKHKVISFLNKLQSGCDENLVTHSLIQEYFLYRDHRFKMHKLIREYFRERDGGKCKEEFDFAVTTHYAELVVNYTELYIKDNMDDEQQHKLLTESHNIEYISNFLNKDIGALLNDTLLSAQGFYELSLQFTKPLVLHSRNMKKQIFFWIVSQESFTLICNHFKSSMCDSFYKVILENTHKSLCNYTDNMSGYFDESCELFKCNIINLTANICQKVHADVCTQVLSKDHKCFYWYILLRSYKYLKSIWGLLNPINIVYNIFSSTWRLLNLIHMVYNFLSSVWKLLDPVNIYLFAFTVFCLLLKIFNKHNILAVIYIALMTIIFGSLICLICLWFVLSYFSQI